MSKIEVDKNLYRWLNCWAAKFKHKDKSSEWHHGYSDAIMDIMHKIKNEDAYPLGNEDNPDWGPS